MSSKRSSSSTAGGDAENTEANQAQPPAGDEKPGILVGSDKQGGGGGSGASTSGILVGSDKQGEGGGQQQPAAAVSDADRLRPVTLKSEHEHAGVKHPAGATIEVNGAEEAWLRKEKIID